MGDLLQIDQSTMILQIKNLKLSTLFNLPSNNLQWSASLIGDHLRLGVAAWDVLRVSSRKKPIQQPRVYDADDDEHEISRVAVDETQLAEQPRQSESDDIGVEA